MTKRKRRVPGITVYRPSQRWAYRLQLDPDPLTGARRRENKNGFETEDAAWDAALASKARHAKGRHVAPSRRTVEAFMTEGLAVIKDELKPSAYQNYLDYSGAYVVPTLGRRYLQDINVKVLNDFYRHLLHAGRRKPDNNSKMYEYWCSHRQDRDGQGPTPTQVAKACGTTLYAAQAAVGRYRRGRTPVATSAGLAPKTVKNIHRMLHRAFRDAVTWEYLWFNPAEHVSLPRQNRSGRRSARPEPWSVDELALWLRAASQDRFAGMWVLAATTGMRRSELAGVQRDLLDLDCGTLTIAPTRIVVAGRPEDSDGKTAAGERTISLDPFTVAALRQHLTMLDEEREVFGTSYPDHGRLMCFEDGTCLHPDTVTRRFNRLVDRVGVRRIHLHDVRHTFSTVAIDAGINPKIVSDRVGHADMNVTFQIYTHRSTGADREAAQTIANLIERAMRNNPADS